MQSRRCHGCDDCLDVLSTRGFVFWTLKGVPDCRLVMPDKFQPPAMRFSQAFEAHPRGDRMQSQEKKRQGMLKRQGVVQDARHTEIGVDSDHGETAPALLRKDAIRDTLREVGNLGWMEVCQDRLAQRGIGVSEVIVA